MMARTSCWIDWAFTGDPALVTIAALMASISTRRLPSTSMAPTVGPEGSGSGAASGGRATGGAGALAPGAAAGGSAWALAVAGPARRHTSATMGRELLTKPRNLVHARENLKGNWPSFRDPRPAGRPGGEPSAPGPRRAAR